MRKATIARFHWAFLKVRWILLGTDPGAGWSMSNLVSLFRTATGWPIELWVIGMGFWMNLGARLLAGVFDQGGNLMLQPIRRRILAHYQIEGGWREVVFNTLFIIVLKTGSFMFCLWVVGTSARQLELIFYLNLSQSILTGHVNCKLIDEVQRAEKLRRGKEEKEEKEEEKRRENTKA